MRAFRAVVAATGILVLAGCGGRIQHAYTPYREAGTALPIEVVVPHKADQPVHGTVYHRIAGRGGYEATRLQLRGAQLWAMLPTETLAPDDVLEYYIDVSKEGKLHALGSPGSPYVVTFLDEVGFMLTRVSHRAIASDTDHPVQIVLFAGSTPVEQPMAYYQMPGVPGDIRAPMEPDGRGNFAITIPPHAVAPGTWRYAVEVPLQGQVHRMPPQGYQSFSVVEVVPPPPDPYRMTVEAIESVSEPGQ